MFKLFMPASLFFSPRAYTFSKSILIIYTLPELAEMRHLETYLINNHFFISGTSTNYASIAFVA